MFSFTTIVPPSLLNSFAVVILSPDYFKLRDLRRLERALTVQIELLASLLKSEGVLNAVVLSVFAEGISELHQREYLSAEIESYKSVREKVRDQINKF